MIFYLETKSIDPVETELIFKNNFLNAIKNKPFRIGRLYSILKYSILINIFLISGLLAQTQQDSLRKDESEYKLKPVIVTAVRTSRPIYEVPYAIDVLSKESIQRGKLQLSLEESLREVPGIIVNNRNNLSQGDRISIRGIGSRASFGVRGIKIILDDIPLTMPDGQSQLNNLDISSIGSLEVLRGPNSALYGNASGGVLIFQTEFTSEQKLLFTPKLTFGSYGLRKLQAKTSLNFKRHNFLINYYNLKLDGFREHSSSKMNSVNIVGHHSVSKHFRFKTVFNYYDSPYLLNPSSLSKSASESTPQQARTFVKNQGAGKEIRQIQAGVSLLYGKKQEKFKLTIYGLSRSLFNPIPGRIIDLSRHASGLRGIFSKSLHINGATIRLTGGADFESQSDDRSEFNNLGLPDNLYQSLEENKIFNQIRFGSRLLEQKEDVLGIGPFVNLEFVFRQNLFFTFGTRYDYYKFKVKDKFLEDNVDNSGERKMDQISPMIGFTYRFDPLASFYINYSTAFQTPTTTELSNRPSGAGGFNPSLEPEDISSFEVGIKGVWTDHKINYDLALYTLQITNMLIPFQVQDTASEEIFFRNAGKATNKGFELKSTWAVITGLKIILSYSYMNFIFKDFVIESSPDNLQLSDNKVPGISPHRIFAGFNYEHDSGFYSEINLKWNDSFFTNDLNGAPVGSDLSKQSFVNPSYFLVDAKFGLQRKLHDFSVHLFFGINNIFDNKYNDSIVPNAFGNRFFEPAPGRNWYTGLSFPISSTK